MTLSEQREEKKNTCIKKLRRTQKFELVNRLFCYACILPFFHAASCVGQREIPMVSGAGTIGFVATAVNAFRLKNKQEKLTEKLTKLCELERR